MSTERKPVAFAKFGGLRLDLPIDEIGGEAAQYLRDVDWDGSTGRLRARDGFQKLKAADASGPYKGLFAHSALRLLAVKRVKSTEAKIVAIDREGTEKTSANWPEAAATACFARLGTPSASYTYCRANLTGAKVVRFDGTSFTEPTCSVDGTTGKEMPRGKFMVAWPDGGDRLIVANTGSTGGPGGTASSNSHVWFSEAEGKAEAYESTAYLQLNPGDGEEITGLAVFGGQVFIFKETKFFVVYGIKIDEEGRPIFEYREVSLGEGSRMKRPTVTALAESSDQLACASSEGVYFCTSAGIFLTTGSTPAKISQALRPLEEVSPFDGPMADFLNGETESFRWPATGISCLGTRLIVRRYEFMFVLDIPTGEWTCWKMSAVSMAIWTGLTGGGSESTPSKNPATAANLTGIGQVAWVNPSNAKVQDGAVAEVALQDEPGTPESNYLKGTGALTESDLPADAIPAGVAVSILRHASLPPTGSFGAQDNVVSLLKEGAIVGANRASAALWGSAFELITYGGPEDLWGTTWTRAQLIAATSGLVFAVKSPGATRHAYVDAMWMVAYFLLPEAASGVRPRLFCTQAKSIFLTKPEAIEEAGTRDAEWQSGFYDLGNADEKTVVEDKMFGRGVVDLSAYSDFRTNPDPQYPITLDMSDAGIGQARSHLSQPSATVLSHKLSLEPGAQVQRLTRYVREGRTPTTETLP